jgi:DNA processing protein
MNDAEKLPIPGQPPLAAPDDAADRLRLSLVPGIGPRLQQALIARFGSAAAALTASAGELRQVQGIGTKLSETIVRARREIDIAAELDQCRRHNVDIVTVESPDYPRPLRDIADPPGVLFVRGTVVPQDRLAIAIVGARHGSHYGKSQAERLAAALARAGFVIVSGLARGIDAAAHRGALTAGGRTYAVLGSGVLNIYPPEHQRLADEIVAAGAVISEAPLRAPPLAGAFPQRNRLISGLSLGVIVVEASLQSGALITARHAMEQGREVFAVPGRIDSRLSRGCHALIRDGARLIESADDVLEELGPLVEPAPLPRGDVVHHPLELTLNDVERTILNVMTGGSMTIDEVVRASQLPTSQVLSAMSALEMRRLVRRLSGNTVARA